MLRNVSSPFQVQFLSYLLLFLGLMGCSASQPTRPKAKPIVIPQIRLDDAPPSRPNTPIAPATASVMLGIDVLESQGFELLKGKRIGLLTHPAGVNRRGERSIDVLRRAPGVKLVALFGPEHGINGDAPAEIKVANSIDKRTGLPVYSLYGSFRKPNAQMLKGLDALVIDLQDIGTRSYTYVSAMRLAMEACFENKVEVIILDRPNPLGGLKVDGPPLDAQWTSYVGAFRVPYVHGLTIAELARMAKAAPGVLEVSDSVREKGKLTVVPMRGWKRSMRWPDTGLRWIPTSPNIADFEAVQGYPMTGLGCYLNGFSHYVGDSQPFRGLTHSRAKTEQLEKELRALKLPGLRFQRVKANTPEGKPGTALFIDITDAEAWRPTELNFYLMKLACKLEPRNPYTAANPAAASLFLKHMGSTAFFEALKRDGARVDVDAYIRDWQARAKIYQQQARKFWLYN